MAGQAIMSGMVEPKNKFGEKLTRLVKRWPGSQRHLADQIDVSAQMLSQYMRGSIPNPSTLISLSRVLGAPLDWLLDESDDRLCPPAPSADQIPIGQASAQDVILRGRQLHQQGTHRLAVELDRAAHIDWQGMAIWLLSHPVRDQRPQTVDIAIQSFQEIERLIGIVSELKPMSPSGPVMSMGVFGEIDPRRIDASTLINRAKALREHNLGILAISYYINHIEIDGSRETYDWNDRRAWLLAQLVTHCSVVDDQQYDQIRQRLRELNWIDEDGHACDHGNIRRPLGYFDIEPPKYPTP